MKRFAVITLAVLMCLGIASCGSKKNQVRPVTEYKYPTTVTDTVADCEFTISIDKDKYTVDDVIIATVSITNKGDGPVGLSAAMLDTVVFYESGVSKPQYYNEDYVFTAVPTDVSTEVTETAPETGMAGSSSDTVSAITAEIPVTEADTAAAVTEAPDEFSRILEPGETVSVTKYFTPGDPVGGGTSADPAKEWRIRAKVEVCRNIPEGFPENEGEYEPLIIGIVAPH